MNMAWGEKIGLRFAFGDLGGIGAVLENVLDAGNLNGVVTHPVVVFPGIDRERLYVRTMGQARGAEGRSLAEARVTVVNHHGTFEIECSGELSMRVHDVNFEIETLRLVLEEPYVLGLNLGPVVQQLDRLDVVVKVTDLAAKGDDDDLAHGARASWSRPLVRRTRSHPWASSRRIPRSRDRRPRAWPGWPGRPEWSRPSRSRLR